MSEAADSATLLPERGPGSRRRRRWFLGGTGVLFAIGLFVFREVLLPFLLGIVLAYVLAPLVARGARVRMAGRRAPRWAVVLALYSGLIGLATTVGITMVPRLAAELTRLAKEAPHAVAVVRDSWLPGLDVKLRAAIKPYLEADGKIPEPVQTPATARATATASGTSAATAGAPVPAAAATPEPSIQVRPRTEGGYEIVLPPQGLRIVPEGERAFRIETARARPSEAPDLAAAITRALARTMRDTEQTAGTILRTAGLFLGALTRGVFAFIMMLMISAFLLVTSDRVFEFFRSLYPPYRRGDFDELVRRIDKGLAGVVRGQLIICCVNAVLSGIGFYVLGLKYWLFLTVLSGVMSIIPIFGSILSTIPAVLFALPNGFGVALLVLGWIVIIHQLEANFLNPKIMGDSARVHPVLVVFALIAGEHVAGLVGALLAVPVLSITQTLFLYLREQALGVPRVSSMVPPAPQARVALAAAGKPEQPAGAGSTSA